MITNTVICCHPKARIFRKILKIMALLMTTTMIEFIINIYGAFATFLITTIGTKVEKHIGSDIETVT